MENNDLQNYITQSRQAGKSDQEIRQELWLKGSTEKEIELILPRKNISPAYIVLQGLAYISSFFVIYSLIALVFGDPLSKVFGLVLFIFTFTPAIIFFALASLFRKKNSTL